MKNHCKRLFYLGLLLALLAGSLGAASVPVAAENPAPPAAAPQGDGPWVVRAYYSDRQLVNELAAWLEPWEVHHDQGYLVVAVDRDQYDRMAAMGFQLEVDPHLTTELTRPREPLPGQVNAIPGFPCYRTVEETYDTALAIVAAYPNLATWIDIGNSWEKETPGGLPGYDLMVLRLTNSAVPGPKPKLFIVSAMHGREYTTAELNTRFAEYLVANYDLDADVTWLLDYHEIHLLLQANPDGRKHAEGGELWRKTTNENYCGPTSPNRGADISRNFYFQWGCCGGSSGDECAQNYRGPSPVSEPETQAIQDYVQAEFPDQRDDPLPAPAPITATGVFLDIHSYTELVIWPWGFTGSPTPNGTGIQTLGRKLAYFNGYYPQQAFDFYITDGTSIDFAYGDLGLATYAYELGTTFFQNCSTFENTILPDNLPSLLYAAKVVRTPYMTPAGPEALALAATPGGVAPGDPVQLTATVDDTRFNNDNGTEPTQDIAAAEYYVDVPPWITTTVPVPYPLAAVDGSFDETVEEVEATIDTAGLSLGRHIVFVRGQDAAGNWGPISAVFLYILDPLSCILLVDDDNDNPDVRPYYTDTLDSLGYEYDLFDVGGAGGDGPSLAEMQGYPMVIWFSGDKYGDSAGPNTTDEGNLAAYLDGGGKLFLSSQDYLYDFGLTPFGQDYLGVGSFVNDSGDASTKHGAAGDPIGDGLGPYPLDYPAGFSDHGDEVNAGVGASVAFTSSAGGGNNLDVDKDGGDWRTVFFGTSWVAVYHESAANGEEVLEQIVGWFGGCECEPVTILDVATTVSDCVVDFSPDYTGSVPIAWQWQFENGTPPVSNDENPAGIDFGLSGTYAYTATATNCGGTMLDAYTDTVTVSCAACIDLTGITILGETSGEPGTYTFTTSYEPVDASQPITYTWDNGDDSGTSVRSLDVGTHTMAVTASNCTDALVTGTHTIVIQQASPQHYIYLPIIVKDIMP